MHELLRSECLVYYWFVPETSRKVEGTVSYSKVVIFPQYTGADSEILKRGALYVAHHGWLTRKILGFRWSEKAEMTLETMFLAKCFYQYFQIFSIFIDKILLIFKIY